MEELIDTVSTVTSDYTKTTTVDVLLYHSPNVTVLGAWFY